MQTDAVVFDIGNVLIEWQPERYYDAVIGRDRREAMFAAVDLHGMNDEVDRGGHFRDDFVRFLAQELEHLVREAPDLDVGVVLEAGERRRVAVHELREHVAVDGLSGDLDDGLEVIGQ